MRLRQRIRPLRAVWAPSRLRRIARHRLTHVATLVVLAAVAATGFASAMAALESERADWGATTPALVVVEPVAVGEPVGPAVATREFPNALTPPDVLTSLAPGAVARVPLFPGEPLLAARVTTGETAFASEGTVALTIPVIRQVPLIEVGALVDLWVVDGANLSSLRVAERVAVLAFSDDDVTVAVPPDQVGDATAASLRPVTITVVG